jgi:FkbM family methyltransferase
MSLKDVGKFFIRAVIGATSRSTVPVLLGPLRGRRLLRQHGLPNLSMLFGTYERDFANAFVKRSRQSTVIYDIGANTGYFSLLSAHTASPDARVYAFEPVPEVLRDLDELARENRLSDSITACCLALSDSNGAIRMYTPASHQTGVIETALRHGEVSSTDFVTATCARLNDYVAEQKMPAPDLIKLDVEGAEGLVLKGAAELLRTARPTILIEVHGSEPAEAVWDQLAAVGYTIDLIAGDREIRVSDRRSWMECFAGSKWTIRHCIAQPGTARSASAAA